MSEKELKAKTKEFNENNMMELIKELMDRPHEEIDHDKRIAIAKQMQKDFEEKKESDDLYFKAAVTAGLVEKELLP